MNESSLILQDAIKMHADWTSTTAEQFEIWLPLLRLLAEGKPVEPERLATVSHHSLKEIEALLHSSGAEIDQEGKVLGWGLTLVPTSHQFHLGEKTLYGWCALDTLLFPALLEVTAQVISSCPASGRTIRLTVTPESIVDLEPTSAVVSVRSPGEAIDRCNVREEICQQGHFFASREVAMTWPYLHPQAILLDVKDAAQLGREMACQVLTLSRKQDTRN
jgi:alkylmercury lyase